MYASLEITELPLICLNFHVLKERNAAFVRRHEKKQKGYSVYFKLQLRRIVTYCV
jgi:hypothetical protein